MFLFKQSSLKIHHKKTNKKSPDTEDLLRWWRLRDLNSGHSGYEPLALAN